MPWDLKYIPPKTTLLYFEFFFCAVLLQYHYILLLPSLLLWCQVFNIYSASWVGHELKLGRNSLLESVLVYLI